MTEKKWFLVTENSLLTEISPTKKSKYLPAQYLQQSNNERNELIKKI